MDNTILCLNPDFSYLMSSRGLEPEPLAFLDWDMGVEVLDGRRERLS